MEQRTDIDGVTPVPPFREMYRQAIEEFWTTQERILDGMGCFATGWCGRRRAGVAAARELEEGLLDCANPMDAMRAWQEWASGSAARLTADGLDAWQQAGVLVAHTLSHLALASVARQGPPANPFAAGWAPVQAMTALMCVMPTANPLQWPLPGRMPRST
jgi:hypothetical protein